MLYSTLKHIILIGVFASCISGLTLPLVYADHTPAAPTSFAIDFDAVNGTNIPLTWTAPSGSLANYTLQGAMEIGGVDSWSSWMDVVPADDQTMGVWHNMTTYDMDTTDAPVTGIYYKLRLVANHGDFSSTPSNEVFGGNIPDNPTQFNSIEDFKSGRAFADAQSFQSMQDFIGIMKFGASTNFDHATKFAAGQNFSESQSFDSHQFFDDNTDFSAMAQTFLAGTSFGSGTTFKSDGSQTLPVGSIPAFGVMLDSVTCDAANCMPTDTSKYLAPGERLNPGIDPVASFTKVKPSDTSLTIDGLGITMNFASITGEGTVKTDLYDPSNVPGAIDSSGGQVTIGTHNSGLVTTIGSVIDLTPQASKVGGDPATYSGSITITMPYLEANIPDGTNESELTVLHFEAGKWKTESNCTVDEENNQITCIVDSLSPFAIGGSPISGSSGGGSDNCNSNGFGNNNSLRVHLISYDVDTHEVQVQVYSTCGSISTKMTTPTQQSILGLSMDQTLLDDRISIYSGYLDESDEKFNISVQNKRDSFSETFYIYDKSIIKKYTGNTGYTSEQQDTFSSTIPSSQTNILSEPSVKLISQTIKEHILVETPKQLAVKTVVVDQIQYTPEPIVEEKIETTCGVGTKLVNGICKIIIPDEPESCFLFWCW